MGARRAGKAFVQQQSQRIDSLEQQVVCMMHIVSTLRQTSKLTPESCPTHFSDTFQSPQLWNVYAPEFVPSEAAVQCEQRCKARQTSVECPPPSLIDESSDGGAVLTDALLSSGTSDMDDATAAVVIQRYFRSWHCTGPLGRFKRTDWLLKKALDFTGYTYLKNAVYKAALASSTSSFDPFADLQAIKFMASCRIQGAWRAFRKDSVSCVSECSSAESQDQNASSSLSSKRVSVMEALSRMGTQSVPVSFPALKYNRRQRKKQKPAPAVTTTVAGVDSDAVLEEALQKAQLERDQHRAATVIQRFWKACLFRYFEDQICLQFTQSDMDKFSRECVSVLQSAHLLTHFFSDIGSLKIEKTLLANICQTFLDIQSEGSQEDFCLAAVSITFPDCLERLFCKSQSVDADLHVTGATVVHWLLKYLVHRRVEESRGSSPVSVQHCAISLAALLYAAKGHMPPGDLPIW
eukprot:TRINITY_DN4185_c0_g1_i6.p1 TRINITY_DN4185_c0_g1~~TRINITY_DN4185_c0_g1_i6.p1  ORF type:complete len:464 (+),score=67.65 TRINITY_DN4185_c0_g1_i6:85-1476(+)